jgi:hypothetical protein
MSDVSENTIQKLSAGPTNSGDIYTDGGAFAHSWRLAQVFASSQLIPKHLQDKPADCLIALALARQLGESPLVVMQNIFIVSGKAGWSAQYMIGRANRAGVFKGRINWRIERREKDLLFQRREKTGWDKAANRPIYKEATASMPDLTVTAYATLADTGETIEFSVTSQMAIAEGWADNVKYSSLGELMLRYRSAAFLIRLYAPDVMLGYQTVEELETVPVDPRDVIELQVEPPPSGVRAALGLGLPAQATQAARDAVVVDVAPAPAVAAPTQSEAASSLLALIADMEEVLGDRHIPIREHADRSSDAGLRAYSSALSAALDRVAVEGA